MVVKRFIVLAALMITLAAFPALAAKRVALVIGNSAYQHTAKLSNPQNDASLMAKTLRRLGFDVLARTNLTQIGMKIAITEFGERLEKAGKDAVGLFYYAGHGIQSNGNNYLIPVDAKLGKKSHLEIYGVNANWVLAQMEEAKNPLNLMVLDACRNNPFGRSWQRGINQGLARMDAPRGTMIAYATRPGKVAADGTGANSPYTRALAKAMVKPGLTLSDVFIETRNTVMASTGGNQVPWEEGGLTSRFYLKPGNASPTATTTPNLDKETVFWQSIKDSTDPDMFNEYLRQYPRGSFAGLARLKVKKLKVRKQAAAITPPRPTVPSLAKPAVGVYPQRYKAGDTFKDCAECPEMVVIPAGSFRMGSPPSEPERTSDEGPQHNVTIPKPIAIGKFEVTQAEFGAVMGWSSGRFKGDRNPVETIDWDNAQAFVRWLSTKTGKKYRLLSEAEWEYAARAGTTTPFYTGSQITPDQANFDSSFTYNGISKGQNRGKTVAVGSFAPNAFGLHDMHGNVSEWVGDCWNETYHHAPTNGGVWRTGDCSRRVIRGGFWNSPPRELRVTYRDGTPTGRRDFNFGFRIARTLF
jgi:formylglycine-generating enzyme required for sulfatase activity